MSGVFEGPEAGAAGFRVVSGAGDGLERLLLAVGRLPAGDVGPVHRHEGEEILHVLAGRLVVRVGESIVESGPGSVVAVPAGVPHGFEVVEEALLEVVAEQRIGTLYRVRDDGGEARLVEVHRPDMPWGRPPPPGRDWTTDEEMRDLLDRVTGD